MSNELTISTPKELKSFLEQSKSGIQTALPPHLSADRLIRLAQTQWSLNAAIRKCTPLSILQSVMAAAQIGIEIGVAGQGYLIPYGTTAQFVPGWQGLVGLLNNTGAATAWTGAVFEGDDWDFQLGSSPRCNHTPGPNFGDPDKITWVYACGKVNGSEQPVVEAWPMARVWKHRDRFNKVGTKHYSYQHPEMYARKVVLLQVLKYMPRSVRLNVGMEASHAADEGRRYNVDDGVVIDMDQDKLPAPPVPDIATKPKKDKPAPKGETLQVDAFWAWCEKKGFDNASVCDWLVKSGHAQHGEALSEEEAAKIDLLELDAAMA